MSALTELFVANVAFEATTADLRELFESVGVVSYLKLVLDGPTQQSKGIAFVKMYADDAQQAITKLNGFELLGRRLVVKVSEPRGPRATLAYTKGFPR